MKTKIFIIVAILTSSDASAALNSCTPDKQGSCGDIYNSSFVNTSELISLLNPYNISSSNCSDIWHYYTGKYCYDTNTNRYVDVPTYAVVSCENCDNGYASVIDHNYSLPNGTTLGVIYCVECKEKCTTNTSAWTGNGAIQSRQVYSWTCQDGCTAKTEYRCNTGYYGKSTNGTTGCTRCESVGGIYGTTIPHDDTSEVKHSECCIPTGTSFSDSTGAGTYTSDCCWSD